MDHDSRETRPVRLGRAACGPAVGDHGTHDGLPGRVRLNGLTKVGSWSRRQRMRICRGKQRTSRGLERGVVGAGGMERRIGGEGRGILGEALGEGDVG